MSPQRRAVGIAALLPLLLALPGCAVQPVDVCSLDHPPADAQVRTTLDVAVATYPAQVPPGYAGCQRMWIGDVAKPDAMRVLATSWYREGRVLRFTGRQPAGASYDCRYAQGALDGAASRNAGLCPLASEIERRN